MSNLNVLPRSPALPARAGDSSLANSLLASLPTPEAALLDPFVRDVILPRDLVLYEADDPIDYVYFPHDALIARVSDFEDGESVVTAVTGRDAACGAGVALDRPRALDRAAVLMSGKAARISAADFQAACLKNTAVREVATRCNALLINQLHQGAACNASHSLEGRLSRWLLDCSDRVGSEVQLTQSTLAQMLGVRRTSVTLVAGSLQSSGAIKYCRGVIHIRDHKALEASACECYRTVRQRAGSLTSNCAHVS
jgi:CRP-like cAMP-binding protein